MIAESFTSTADAAPVTEYLSAMYASPFCRWNAACFVHLTGLIDLPKSARILDVGCGTGLILKHLHRAGFTNLHGVDNCPKLLNRASVRGITTYCANALEISNIFGHRFDAIILSNILHHLPQRSRVRLLEDCEFLLLTGGRLFIREPYRNLCYKGLEKLSRWPLLKHSPHLAGYELEADLLASFLPWWEQRRLHLHGLTVERDFNWWTHRVTVARVN